jgi:hypothetical protein
MTDQQQQQKVNEAAEQFTDALVQSYKTVAERGVSAQEGSTQVTEVFFNQTINNLRAQAEENRQATQQLADQQQRQADAAQTLTRESIDAYMHFMDSMFSWWQGGIQTAERGARETEKATKGQKS